MVRCLQWWYICIAFWELGVVINWSWGIKDLEGKGNDELGLGEWLFWALVDIESEIRNKRETRNERWEISMMYVLYMRANE